MDNKVLERSDKSHTPFSCTYSPVIPEFLNDKKITIGISTYQAGKVIFLSALDDNRIIQLPRNFPRAMAVGKKDRKIAIASKDEVVVLAHEPSLAGAYPKKPNTYDTLYVPHVTYHTGALDIHGLAWGADGLWAVNTSFSCLCLLSEDYSFIPKWQPPFITKLASEDRCHLNSFAFKDGKPAYVTTFGDSDEYQGWRKKIPGSGMIINVDSNEILARDLPMPHSLILEDNSLLFLLSATGELARLDLSTGKTEVLKKIGGFVRGMAKHDDHLFIAVSKLRQNSSTFKDLPIAEENHQAGIIILHLPTLAVMGQIRYNFSVDEIFDVFILPDMQRPGIINTESDIYKRALSIPGTTFWGRPEKKQ